MGRGIPADASGATWPRPQTNDNIFSREKSVCSHPPLNGYKSSHLFLSFSEKMRKNEGKVGGGCHEDF
jgi:ppGpp synthetase/RelA/SpoT-type nucleotidyltranferase